MAITYNWRINQLDCHVQHEGKTNVIHNVHWSYCGSKEHEGKTYTVSTPGSQSFEYNSGDAFTDYENTEAFEKVVISWLESALDMTSMKAAIDADINKQITPVSKKLHFTWNDETI